MNKKIRYEVWVKDSFFPKVCENVFINKMRVVVLDHNVFIPVENISCWERGELIE